MIWFLITSAINVFFYRRSHMRPEREAALLSPRAMLRAVIAALIMALPWAVVSPAACSMWASSCSLKEQLDQNHS